MLAIKRFYLYIIKTPSWKTNKTFWIIFHIISCNYFSNKSNLPWFFPMTLWHYLLYVRRSLAESADTCCRLRSGKNCGRRQCGRCHSHDNDIAACPHHRTGCKWGTCTANKKHVNGWQNYKKEGRERERIADRILPCQSARRTSRTAPAPSAACCTQSRWVPWGFYDQSDAIRSRRGSNGTCRTCCSTASKKK